MLSNVSDERRIEPLFISIRECCRVASLSSVTVYRLIAAGKLTAVKAGSKTLIEVASLQSYLGSLPRLVGRTGVTGKAV
ncbi:excisionase family DNA-binding protein [Geminicoccus flavidas]|uniref:excisionase family DNA-binding protein n=1 Tax=Geminicoccus flavidas TaxID=2506407 RepID=UPI0013593773|nr:excisionase family DNA-binding protein [Geminicoccus flavidas]